MNSVPNRPSGVVRNPFVNRRSVKQLGPRGGTRKTIDGSTRETREDLNKVSGGNGTTVDINLRPKWALMSNRNYDTLIQFISSFMCLRQDHGDEADC